MSMAIADLLLPILLMSLMSFAIGVQARPGIHFHPCRMFLVSVSYSVSSTTKDVTTVRSFDSFPQLESVFPSDFFLRRFDAGSRFFPDWELSHTGISTDFLPSVKREEFVLPAMPHIADSARDRARDILSVVISLILGAGCGILVASTMYLVWSLINHHCHFESVDDEEEIKVRDGYVKIPAEFVPVKVKEGYEGNQGRDF